MKSPRVSNTQLKALLANLETAALADHPLAEMFRGFVRDALLDLRDTRQYAMRMEWLASYFERNVRLALDECEQARSTRLEGGQRIPPFVDTKLRQISWYLNEANTKRPDDDFDKESIAPLTGDEK